MSSICFLTCLYKIHMIFDTLRHYWIQWFKDQSYFHFWIWLTQLCPYMTSIIKNNFLSIHIAFYKTTIISKTYFGWSTFKQIFKAIYLLCVKRWRTVFYVFWLLFSHWSPILISTKTTVFDALHIRNHRYLLRWFIKILKNFKGQ